MIFLGDAGTQRKTRTPFPFRSLLYTDRRVFTRGMDPDRNLSGRTRLIANRGDA